MNQTLGNIFKASEMLEDINTCLTKVSNVVLMSESATKAIQSNIQSWNSINTELYGPGELFVYGKSIIRNLVTVFEMDLAEQRKEMKGAKKKTGWKIAGAIGLGLAGVAAVVACPVAAVAAGALANTAIGATTAAVVAAGTTAAVGKTAIEGANELVDNANSEKLKFSNGIEQDEFFINELNAIELKYATCN